MCDYAGIDTPARWPGRSARALAEGAQPSDWRNELVIETYLDLGGGPPNAQSMGRALRTERYQDSVYAMGRHREQLVDLNADPGEMVNLAVDAGYREVLNDHRRRLLSWCKETGDTFARMCMA